jgi:hypothetical protein
MHKIDNQLLKALLTGFIFISVKITLNRFGSFKEVLIFTVKYIENAK